MNLSDLITESHATSVEKGWWDEKVGRFVCSCVVDGQVGESEKDCVECNGYGFYEAPMESRSFPEQIALMHSELSEALEEFRKHGMNPEKFIYFNEGSEKPEGIAVELADELIRKCDTAGKYNIPLAEALRLKLAYNKTRPRRHGGKKA